MLWIFKNSFQYLKIKKLFLITRPNRLLYFIIEASHVCGGAYQDWRENQGDMILERLCWISLCNSNSTILWITSVLSFFTLKFPKPYNLKEPKLLFGYIKNYLHELVHKRSEKTIKVGFLLNLSTWGWWNRLYRNVN